MRTRYNQTVLQDYQKMALINIENPKVFHKVIKKLRQEKASTPLSDEFEVKSKDITWRQETRWYETQGEHWQNWIGNHFGFWGFFFNIFGPSGYERSNIKRTSAYIYNHIMCPPMITWLAEALKVDTTLLKTAITEAETTTQYQKQCGILRKTLTWEIVKKQLISNHTRLYPND